MAKRARMTGTDWYVVHSFNKGKTTNNYDWATSRREADKNAAKRRKQGYKYKTWICRVPVDVRGDGVILFISQNYPQCIGG